MSDEEIILTFKNMIINSSLFLFSILLFFNPSLLTHSLLMLSIFVIIKCTFMLMTSSSSTENTSFIKEYKPEIEPKVYFKPTILPEIRLNDKSENLRIKFLEKENEGLKDRVRKLRKEINRLRNSNLIVKYAKPVGEVKKIDVQFEEEKEKKEVESVPESLPDLVTDDEESEKSYVVS